ncbi:STAS domain-containing protein [Pseudonocardia saturnea]
MTSFQPFQLAVECAATGVRVIRVAGALDRPAVDRLLRLVDAQIDLRAAGCVTFEHLVVDLANVTRFDPGGLEALQLQWRERRDRGVRLHLAGCGGRVFLLPVRASRMMRDFSAFPSAEVAIAQLSPPTVDVPAPRPPSDSGDARAALLILDESVPAAVRTSSTQGQAE